MQKFVIMTYKELLKKFLGGRGASAHSLNQLFFAQIFMECNYKLGQSLMKPLLRYLLPSTGAGEVNLGESEASEGNKDKTNARSNHQRLLAIDIFNTLVKSAHKNTELLNCLINNIELIADVLVSVLKCSDTWQ